MSVADFIFFFFSSRRRHTRFDCDWSSDVCSSDLMSRAGCRQTRQSGSRRFRRPAVPARSGGPGWRRWRPGVRRQESSVSSLQLPQRTKKTRSEEHTSELQSQSNLVCRLLLEKKKKKKKIKHTDRTKYTVTNIIM